MATLALVAFNAAGGSILVGGSAAVGAIVSTAAAAYIDAAFVMPSLFPVPDTKGPRLDDLKLQSGKEGSPLTRCYGPQFRTAGTVIWITDLIENKKTQSGGGKGGSGGDFITYTYNIHMAVAVCDGPVSNVSRVWADGKVVYAENPDVDYTSTSITATVEDIYGWVQQVGLILPTWEVVQQYLVLSSPDGGPDLSKLKSGIRCTVDGFTAPATVNNDTEPGYFVVSSKKELDGTSEVKLDAKEQGVVPVAKAATDSVVLHMDLPKFSGKFADDVRIYPGDSTQLPDSLIESLEGTGLVPAWRGVCYVVFENLRLLDYGNRPPNFEFEVEERPSMTRAELIGALMDDAGYAASEYDTSGVTGDTGGFGVRGPTPTSTSLQPIQLAYDIVTRQDGEKLVFEDRASVASTNIPAKYLSASTGGDEPIVTLGLGTGDDASLPSSIGIVALDPANDLQSGESFESMNNVRYDNNPSIDLPLVLTETERDALAKRVLYVAWATRDEVRLSLPPRYLVLKEATRITFTADGEDWDVLVNSIDRGQNYLIQLTGHVEDDEALLQTGLASEKSTSAGGSGNNGGSSIGNLGYVEWDAVSIPLSNEHLYSPVLYFFAANAQYDEPWRGATVYASGQGDTWVEIGRISDEATMGPVTSLVSSLIDVDPGCWDRVNSITIEVPIWATLVSVTEEECNDGYNRAMFGQEVIGFATVVLDSSTIDAKTYTLSTLLRGLRATEEFIDAHQDGERFVSLTQPGITAIPISMAQFNQTRAYVVAPPGAAVTDLPSRYIGTIGGSMTQMMPQLESVHRNGSDDLLIKWRRRTRAIGNPWSTGAPLADDDLRYEIDYSATLAGTVVRTAVVSVEAAFVAEDTYTAVEQTADNLTPGNTVYARVYLKSRSSGRSRPLILTVT